MPCSSLAFLLYVITDLILSRLIIFLLLVFHNILPDLSIVSSTIRGELTTKHQMNDNYNKKKRKIPFIKKKLFYPTSGRNPNTGQPVITRSSQRDIACITSRVLCPLLSHARLCLPRLLHRKHERMRVADACTCSIEINSLSAWRGLIFCIIKKLPSLSGRP